jgi:hypothetical protein
MNDQHNGNYVMVAMVAMMAMCAVPLLLFALIPALGLIPGVAVGLVVGGAMVFLHFKFMHTCH